MRCVPNFEFLKAQGIGNVREWVVWELENLGRELPEYQRVHDFVLRAEPLPRTTTRKIQRFELRSQLEGLGAREASARKLKPALSEQDVASMHSAAGRATVAAIKQHVPELDEIHPQMNFEIDLGLDSLARAECFASVEHGLGIELKPEEVSVTQTVGELIQLASSKSRDGLPLLAQAVKEFHWHDLLKTTAEESPEVKELLRNRRALALFAYGVLKLIYLLARLLLRMEVRGREVLTQFEGPYLICPNHQSYIDPFVVCSTYPRRVVENIFHVGASMYFTNVAMAQLSRLINVVPIDPDRQLLRAMRAAAAGLRAGKILNIYPEGQRSFDGHLLEFKKGAAILATELRLPILPVAVEGTYRIWPCKSWRFRLVKVKISFGMPIDVPKIASSEINAEAAYQTISIVLKERIQQMLEEMRRESNE